MRQSSKLEVNLNYLIENYFKIKDIASHHEILPMVKANGYGNGLIEVSRSLIKDCSVSQLGVASLGEAIEINKQLEHENVQLVVFSDSELENPQAWDWYEHNKIIPVIHRKSDLEIFLSKNNFKNVPLYLKLNSGMNRLGLDLEEILPYIKKIKERGVDHLMSHFSGSYQKLKSGDRSHRQLDLFLRMKNELFSSGVEIRASSISNSGAIEQKFGLSESAIRPGLMLYGPWSTEPSLWKGKQISRLTTKVIRAFEAKKGTPLGYGINVLGEDSFVILVALGYGDGILTFMSGVEINIKGYRGKIFGRVNMDMTYIVFSPDINGKIIENEIVEIWGHDNTIIPHLSSQMKTNAYQVMTSVSLRVPREYIKK